MWNKKFRARIIGTACQCVSNYCMLLLPKFYELLGCKCAIQLKQPPSTLVADLFRCTLWPWKTKLVHVLFLITVTPFLTAVCLSWTSSCARKKLAHLWPTPNFWDESDAVIITSTVGIVWQCTCIENRFLSWDDPCPDLPGIRSKQEWWHQSNIIIRPSNSNSSGLKVS